MTRIDARTMTNRLMLLVGLGFIAGCSRDPNSPQTAYRTPDEAASAIVDAAEKFNVPELERILGPIGVKLVVTEDAVQDSNVSVGFAAQARHRMYTVADSADANLTWIVVGQDDWPFPIPLVKKGGKWRFDTAHGADEILNRRIGRNELDAIDISHGYVEAQNEYAADLHDGSNFHQYAQKIISSPGKHDGLAWENPDSTWGGPVGEGIARAIAEGYSDHITPYHGYYYKILKGQGPNAPMGAIDFVIGNVMIGGFGLVASPAQYGSTGIMTFIVSHDDVVYQKDLGPGTADAFKAMELYNPDSTWTAVTPS